MSAAKHDPAVASDGLLARASGFWAREKLRRLEIYSQLVTTSMKGGRKWKGLVFVDLMAGPGMCVDARTVTEFAGSTLRALSTVHPFTHIVAVEKNVDNAAALTARVAAHPRGTTCAVLTADCNDPEVIAQIRARTDGCLTLMFVDLIGTEVTMATIRELTRDRSIDLVITWPQMDVTRNRGQFLDDAQRPRWSAFFGTPDWVDVAKGGPTRRVHALTELYQQQLHQIGYTTHLMHSVKNTRGGRLYRQLFATRHPLGETFWFAAAPKEIQQGLGF